MIHKLFIIFTFSLWQAKYSRLPKAAINLYMNLLTYYELFKIETSVSLLRRLENCCDLKPTTIVI